jgi:hypothetical protein
MAKGEWKEITKLINAASNILDLEAPMTIRQLFYRLVSAGLIPNDRNNYQLVSRIVTKARDDGRIPFSHIVDRSRPQYSPNVWNNAEDYADTVKRGYRRDYWHTQPNYVELWVEKDAIIGSIEKVTDELGITIRVGRGFLSTTKAHEIARHFARITKPITVFYLGDHDPSGHCIESDFFDRIQNYGSGEFELKRLAIFARDIKTYNLPPLRLKDRDNRAAKFVAQHGADCVELDALPPDVLRARIKDSVEEMLDMDLWERAVKVEEVEMASIKDTVGRWQNLATADASEFRSIRDGI